MAVVASVTIPAFNATKTIGDCLRALERQDFPRESMEVIVADNASRDDTFAYVASNFPWVRLVRAPRPGSSSARNAALEVAVGRYICTTDADCIPEPNWVRALVEALERSPSGTLCAGGAIVPYSVRTIVERYRIAWIKQSNLQDPAQRFTFAETPNACFLREAFERVGRFDENVGHDDSDLGLRLTKSGAGFVFAPEAVVRHRNPATLAELYAQRRKYAYRSMQLRRKHPDFMPPITEATCERRQMFFGAVKRILKNLLIWLPRSILFRDFDLEDYGLRVGPLFDCVTAVAVFFGTREACRDFAREESRPEDPP